MRQHIALIIPSEDGYLKLFPDDLCDYCDLIVIPVSYTINNVMFYDGLNTDNEIFFNNNFLEKDFDFKGIPEPVYTEVIDSLINKGFDGVLLFTPSKRWSKTYKNAVKSLQKVKRRVNYKESGFKSAVIDTKTFSTAVGCMAVRCAQKIIDGASFEEAVEYADELADKTRTLVFETYPKDLHSFIRGHAYNFDKEGHRCIRIAHNKILPIKSKGDEEQGIEKFVRDCVRNLEPDMNYCLCEDKDYLNRMEKLLTKAMGKEPISSSPMSAASAFEFSANSIIVTIF